MGGETVAENIKGINVTIGSDTTGLAKALGDVNKHAKNIQRELWQVEKLLKLDPKNTELVAQKQKLLGDAVKNSEEKLNKLKTAQEQVNEQFKNGEISAGQYRAFEREIVNAEQQLDKFKTQLGSTNSKSELFAQKMQAIGDKLRSIGDKMSSVGKSMTTSISLPIAAVGTAITVMATKAAGATDRIDKLSQRLGLSRKSFQELEFVLSQSGSSMESLQSGMKVMVQRMADLETGTGKGSEAFQKLGISFDDIKDLSQEDIFKLTVERFNEMEDGAEKAALAQDLFSRSGQELLPLLNANSGAVEEMTKQAHDLGLVLSDESIDAGVMFTDTMDQIKRSLGAVTTNIGTKLMPAFKSLIPIIQNNLVPAAQHLASKVSGLVTWFTNLSPKTQKLILGLAGLAAALGPVLIVVGKITTGVGALVPLMTKLGTVIGGISLPVVGTVAVIAALATVAIEVYRNWEQVKDSLGAIWEVIKASVQGLVIGVKIAFEGMKTAVLGAVNFMIEKLGVLEKIPFGVGDKFKGLKDSITDSVDSSALKIQELKDQATENGKKLQEATKNMGVSFGDLGSAIFDDVKSIISSMTGMTKTTEEELANQTETIEVNAEEQTNIIDTNMEEQNNIIETGLEDQNTIVEEKTDLQTAIIEDAAEEQVKIREKFESEWTKKLFNATASRLKKLEEEKQEALKEAEELGADKTAILAYYAQIEQEILDKATEEKQKKQEVQDKLDEQTRKAQLEAEQKKAETLATFEEGWTNKVLEQSGTRAEILEAEKQEALKKAEELGVDKTAILEFYTQEEQKIKDADLEIKKKQAEDEKKIIEGVTGKWSDSLVSFVDTIASGQKTFKEAMKDMLLNLITMLEKQVIASQLAATGIAWANATWDWGVSLAKLGAALPKLALTMAGFEGLKGAIRGLATGGKVVAPTMALIGEGADNEAVLPLNQSVFSELGRNIAANMPQPVAVATSSSRPAELHLHIGTLVADDLGLKKLERTLSKFRIGETTRLGGAT